MSETLYCPDCHLPFGNADFLEHHRGNQRVTCLVTQLARLRAVLADDALAYNAAHYPTEPYGTCCDACAAIAAYRARVQEAAKERA